MKATVGPSFTASLRRAVPADAADIAECVRSAYQHYVARLGQLPGPMLDDYLKLIGQNVVVVAIVDASIAGILVLEEATEGFLLQNVAVHPAWQRRGLGRLLLAHAERCAREAGHDSICLYTNELMVENRYLYSGIGYREYERRLENGFSRVYMRKVLAPVPRTSSDTPPFPESSLDDHEHC